MKIWLICLGLFYSVMAVAIPTISMPDLIIEKDLPANSDTNNPLLPQTVVKVVPKFSSDIRGGLVKSGEFKVINVKTPADALVYIDDNLPESHTPESSMILESGSALAESANQLIAKQQSINPATEYYLIGIISYIGENEDSYPLKNTNNMTKQYVIEVTADFKLIRAKDKAVMAAFSANGRASDVKIVSIKNLHNTAWHHNIGKLVSNASKDLAANVLQEMETQFNFTLQKEEKDRKANESVVVTDVKEYN